MASAAHLGKINPVEKFVISFSVELSKGMLLNKAFCRKNVCFIIPSYDAGSLDRTQRSETTLRCS